VVRVSLASTPECTVGPGCCSAGPGRGRAACAVTCEDVGDAEGVPAVRVGYWRAAALAAVLEAAFEAEEPILMFILVIVRMFDGDSVVETKWRM